MTSRINGRNPSLILLECEEIRRFREQKRQKVPIVED